MTLKATSHDITTWIKIIQKYSIMTLDTNSTTEHMQSPSLFCDAFIIVTTGVMPPSRQRKHASGPNSEVVALNGVAVR